MSRFIDFTLPSTVPGRTLHGFRCVPEGPVSYTHLVEDGTSHTVRYTNVFPQNRLFDWVHVRHFRPDPYSTCS